MISSSIVDRTVRAYEGIYDPHAIFSNLRRDNVLGPYSYLYIGPEQAEIGWAPIEHLTLLGSERPEDWRGKLRAFAHNAQELGRKAVGYVGFDAVDSNIGTLPDRSVTGLPLVEFIIPGEVTTITRDRVEHLGVETVQLERCLCTRSLLPENKASLPLKLIGQTSEDAFVGTVGRALETIALGTIQKVVLSRYEAYESDFQLLSVLSALSGHQSSSYLLCFGDLIAIVPSPELLLAGKHRRITTNPLAGTRRCGDSPMEEQRLREDLQADHKEIVEHMLAVMTMFSELKSVCDPETLCINRLMEIARHKRVQHLSSVLSGTLMENREVLDALWALFPSVTVTGAPKAAALREVRTLEANPRYLYSGAIGWVSGADDCEFMLAIRSVFRHRDRTFLQAGAGIIAESHPQSELAETRHKLRAMKEAIAGIS